MMGRNRILRSVMGFMEVLLLVLLALSMGRFFSEEVFKSGTPTASLPAFFQTRSVSPAGAQEEGAPFIRIIAPTRGPADSTFTLVGNGFNGLSQVLFYRPEGTLEATIASASDEIIVAAVPADADLKTYAVTVVVDGQGSNAAVFDVTNSTVPIELSPNPANLLLPPGSGVELLAVGGGVPPYTLQPLSGDDSLDASVELNGTVIEVTGLQLGSVRIEVEDSSPTPVRTSATVNLIEPDFEPSFNIQPHTLLAESTPGFTINLQQFSNDMRLVETEIEFGNTQAVLEGVTENGLLGLSTEFNSTSNFFMYLQVTDPKEANGLAFDIVGGVENRTEVTHHGQIDSRSATLTLTKFPQPPPEGVTRSTFQTEIVLNDKLFRLPAAGESFDITARFTSNTSIRGEEAILTKEVTRSFVAIEPPQSAPRIESMHPVKGAIGSRIEIQGSGFDLDLAEVIFPGTNGPVKAILESVTPEEIIAFVPNEALTGAIRVEVGSLQSNDFRFEVLFRPQVALFFPDEDDPGPLAPVILLTQGDDSVDLETLTARVDGASLDLGGLALDEVVGLAPLTSRTVPPQIFYSGQEELPAGSTEMARHIFELKETVDVTAVAILFVSQTSDAPSVLLELVPNTSLSRQSLTIDFETGILIPENGQIPDSILEVRSERWNFFSGTEMVVIAESQGGQ